LTTISFCLQRHGGSYVSPVFASEKNGTLGPILIQVGSEERLRDESLKFAANFKQSDIRLEMYKGNMMCNVLGQVHCFQGFNGQASTLALKNIKQFIDNPQTFQNGIYAIDKEKIESLGAAGALKIVNDGKKTLEDMAKNHVLSVPQTSQGWKDALTRFLFSSLMLSLIKKCKCIIPMFLHRFII
jgi:hypothetical protein